MADDKLNVEIEYRHDRGHALRAAWMGGRHSPAEAANIESFKHVPSGHGKFHMTINDELVAFNEHRPDAHLFPDLQDMMKSINKRIDG